MRRAIIHIGTPRTGSSSLQTVLFRHRAALREAGILYPDLTPRAAPLPHLSHQHLGAALAGRRPLGERRELLDALASRLAASRAEAVVISYEGLCLFPSWHPAPGLLCDLLRRHGYEPEILLTVRAQAAYLQSQHLWRLQFLAERRPFAAAFAADLGHRRYDYLYGLDGWARAARGRVSVVPYRDRRADAPLIVRVAAELGLADRLLPLMSADDLACRANRSLDPVSAEVARRLAASGIARRGEQARAVTARIEALAAERGLGGAFQALDAGMLERAAAHYRATNELLARRVWATGWDDRIEAPHILPATELAGRPLDRATEGEVEAIRRLVIAELGLGTGGRLARALARAGEEVAISVRRLPILAPR
ncbi:hypothetical protein M446_0014 [Methylobacterium sp. 4-46]|uniref:hypothetical protein n=1 Tax=unclassified Methylobacterium TaxID=2615210 RepID=UPI000165C56A|nr:MULTISPECIES: hypothetical protein [Methylobacterium]ACA14602.1 hypothetical protein M446_0014 [Methylobacterium sp. 4-46]WFT80358.1 hypothetical protein QA634_00075 [Methylobacterium nodulans]